MCLISFYKENNLVNMINNRSLGLGGLQYGHIFLPFPGKAMDKDSQEGIDYRDTVIKQCFRKQKVSVLFDNGTFANNCPISLSALRDVEFPEKFGQVGSSVLCFIEPMHKKPMIIALYGKESDVDFSNEGDKKLSSVFKNSRAEVGVKGKTGEAYINVDSSEDSGGNIWINISNASNTGKLNIKVLGDSNIYSLGNCNITASGNITASVTDDQAKKTTLVNLSKSGVTVTRDGKGLKDTLKNLINELVAFKTISPGGNGVTSPDTITNLQGYLNDLDKYLED